MLRNFLQPVIIVLLIDALCLAQLLVIDNLPEGIYYACCIIMGLASLSLLYLPFAWFRHRRKSNHK